MNTDDFEKKLQRQSLRKIPGDWREEILRAARTNTSAARERSPGFFARAATQVWRELLWPCRHAWSAMAALWIGLWLVNARVSGGAGPAFAGHSGMASAPVESFVEQRRVLVELTGPFDAPPAATPQRLRPQPRSERALANRIC